MAFPASTDPLADALIDVRRTAESLKARCITARDQMASDSVSSNVILRLADVLRKAIDTFNGAAGVSGITDYARNQYDDPSLNIVAEFNAMLTACEGARDWIVTNFPQHNGFLLAQSIAADGTVSQRMFTPTQTATFRTQLDNVIASIA